MIDKETFRKTEGRLYRYFKQIKEIEKLDYVCRELENQKERIRKDLQETNISLEEESKSMTYEERVQTSSSGCGYAEKEAIRQITRLEEEWKYIRKKLLKKRARIRELERQIAPLKFNLSMLSEENKRFIEWKYAECKSVGWIAIEMYAGARATAYRKREELVEDIAQWCNLIV